VYLVEYRCLTEIGRKCVDKYYIIWSPCIFDDKVLVGNVIRIYILHAEEGHDH
jgi:hypothetical protein